MFTQHPPTSAAVLIVEDQPMLMLTMVDLVEQAGCIAVEATSIAEAIGILETRADIRTVFTDLDMRGSVPGMQLAVAIRDRWPPIELIMTSSDARPEGLVLPDRAVYVGKPFDRRKVVAAIRLFAGA